MGHSLLALALLFSSFASHGEEATIRARSSNVALWAKEAVAAEGPVFDDPGGEGKTEALLVRVVFLESRGDPRAKNPKGDRGLAQLRALWWRGHTEEEVLDPVLNLRLAVLALRELKASCGGDAERWLGAFASGRCGGAPSTARARCAPLGLCRER